MTVTQPLTDEQTAILQQAGRGADRALQVCMQAQEPFYAGMAYAFLMQYAAVAIADAIRVSGKAAEWHGALRERSVLS